MSRYHDDRTAASNPGEIDVDAQKLQLFREELSLLQKLSLLGGGGARRIEEHMIVGDGRAAVVVQTEPKLIVSAYTDEIDDVALLEFSPTVLARHPANVGDRLLTVNTYRRGAGCVDLKPGPNATGQYGNFYPIVAEFLASDPASTDAAKAAIDEPEWERAQRLGTEKLNAGKRKPRRGNPFLSDRPR